MAFNLIEQQWIPVRRRSGTRAMIAPWQINERDDPPLALDAPRPDFNGALIQFLIGLVQTTAAPADDARWHSWFDHPPTPATLHEHFAKVSHAFNLDGDGPRFMQDPDPLEDGTRQEVTALLIDFPPEKTVGRNADHFVKRREVAPLCLPCAATALFAMQTNAPEGGRGHFTSLRGGGPLTTLVVGNDLWQDTWLNVLPTGPFLAATANEKKTDDSCRYPWCGQPRPSHAKARCLMPEEAHPSQVFWAMPRRIRLVFDQGDGRPCDVCGAVRASHVGIFLGRPNGIKYEGPWRHTLSPYGVDEAGAPVAKHIRGGAPGYQHWLGLVQEDGGRRLQPALVIHHFRESIQRADMRFRLLAFGYDMDHMKPSGWYEGTMPLTFVRVDLRDEYEEWVARMVRAASEIASNLVVAVKRAWLGSPTTKGGRVHWGYPDIKKLKDDELKERDRVLASVRNQGAFQAVQSQFWSDTEPGFYDSLDRLLVVLGTAGGHAEVLQPWHQTLMDEAEGLFDRAVTIEAIEDSRPKAIALARKQLHEQNGSRRIRTDLLGFS